ncbi:hypothetical protein KM043_003864 [Ampulex compressa]|nr:hypothetical protein KM043_003864 [Ampulex compressa]
MPKCTGGLRLCVHVDVGYRRHDLSLAARKTIFPDPTAKSCPDASSISTALWDRWNREWGQGRGGVPSSDRRIERKSLPRRDRASPCDRCRAAGERGRTARPTKIKRARARHNSEVPLTRQSSENSEIGEIGESREGIGGRSDELAGDAAPSPIESQGRERDKSEPFGRIPKASRGGEGASRRCFVRISPKRGTSGTIVGYRRARSSAEAGIPSRETGSWIEGECLCAAAILASCAQARTLVGGRARTDRDMPALKLFGRKWLAATDDLVYPGFFEIFIRVVWFILIGVACARYYKSTWNCHHGGELVRAYLLGEALILGITMFFLLLIVRHSAKGSIMDTHARRYVEPLLTIKVLLLLPEICWNVLGSLWISGRSVACDHEHYTITVVQALVFFDWILIGLTIFGLALVFDPLGSLGDQQLESSAEHGKVSSIWLRRFKFLWWMRKDESADETFQHVAALLSALFRGTDLVPSDIVAGSILLRVRQKREIHELRRLNLIGPSTYTSDCGIIFANTPTWMSLEDAHHYIRLSIASYGWLFVVYQHACTGCFRLIRGMSCCACFRRKRNITLGDNCCLCYHSGVKYLSELTDDDILFASFRNHLCEVPFCVVAHHKTSSIVIIVRGSLSLRDLITDIAAAAETFRCDALPEGSMAHKGMIACARFIGKQLHHYKVLERAFTEYPQYRLTITGHSLGAGTGILLGLLLRPSYPNLRVYAFATPAGLLSREAARVTEEFVLTIGVGDDLVMRLGVDSIENLRTSLLMTLRACRLPKYRVVLNGLGYALFGVPERDLNKAWENYNIISSIPGQLPLLVESSSRGKSGNGAHERDIARRRYSKVKLFTAGRILHIARCKAPQQGAKSKGHGKKEKRYEMRWAQPEEFMGLSVMPRMLLDHFPDTIEKTIGALLEQQSDLPFYFDP